MTLTIDLSQDAEEFLESLPPKYRRQVVSKIFDLAENPRLRRTEQLEPPLERFRKARSGLYRIIYTADQDTLKIYIVDHRKHVYRKARRQLN